MNKLQIAQTLNRPLTGEEQRKVKEMYDMGFTVRQVVSKLKEMAAYEFANKRRMAYLKKLNELGTGPIKGAEVIKLQKNVDYQTGINDDWEKMGYPAYYRSGLLETIAANKTKSKKQVKKKEATKLKKQVKESKSKKKKGSNSMNQVD